jgi:xylulokinase
MIKDVVVGLDSSTTATKAIAWNRRGEPIAAARSPLPLSSPRADWYEQDSADWWESACSALRQLQSQIDPARIAAIAISNQRETFVPLVW